LLSTTPIRSGPQKSPDKLTKEGRNGAQFGLYVDPPKNTTVIATQNGHYYTINKPCPSTDTDGDSPEPPIWSSPQKSPAKLTEERRNGA